MKTLLRSEVLKIRSTQVWIWMLLVAIVLTTVFTLGSSLGQDKLEVEQYHNQYDIFTISGSAGIAMLILGLLGLTTEFRHKTITPTLLATPNRWKLLTGKALAYVIFAIPYGIVSIAVNVVVATICLNARGVHIFFDATIVGGIVRAFVSLVFLAFFGLGLGALIRNQAAGMVIGIAYLFVLNPLLSAIPYVRKAYPYEFGGALSAFTSRTRTSQGISHDVHAYGWQVGLVIAVIWCVGLVVLGGFVSLRRDIS